MEVGEQLHRQKNHTQGSPCLAREEREAGLQVPRFPQACGALSPLSSP